MVVGVCCTLIRKQRMNPPARAPRTQQSTPHRGPLARKHLESAPVAALFTATLQTLEQAAVSSALSSVASLTLFTAQTL